VHATFETSMTTMAIAATAPTAIPAAWAGIFSVTYR
jgi:hypothetical protein